jgi:hypothetical protein
VLRCGIIQSVPCNCNYFLIYCVPHLSYNPSRFIHQSSLLWLQKRHLLEKQGKTRWEMATQFYLSVFLSYLKGSLTYNRILWHGANGFPSPPQKVVLRIFIAFKIHLWPSFEPTNLGSNGKHNNHYTTKKDCVINCVVWAPMYPWLTPCSSICGEV